MNDVRIDKAIEYMKQKIEYLYDTGREHTPEYELVVYILGTLNQQKYALLGDKR
jgi:hypothetical protein